jgi:hypothetical protein
MSNKIKNERERIILYKSQFKRMYLRKQSNSFLNYRALSLCNKQNQVIEFGWHITDVNLSPDNVKEYAEMILGKARANKIKPNDEYRLLDIHTPIKLLKPYNLEKPVRGIRYATSEETYDLKKALIKTIAQKYNITYEDVFWNWANYPELYSLSMIMDFQDVLFDLEKTGELYEYRNDKTKLTSSDYKPIRESRQTKLC